MINELVKESLDEGASGVIDEKSSGKVIIKELNASIQSVYIKHCEPLHSDKESLESEWKYCRCVVFVGIPGGRESIVERAITIEKSKPLK